MKSINVVDNRHFRELLQYVGQGNITEDTIPGRTYLTGSIIKAWKAEQEEFYQEMKVCCTPGSHPPPGADLTVVGRNP